MSDKAPAPLMGLVVPIQGAPPRPPVHRRQAPEPLSPSGLAMLRAEAENYAHVPSRHVRRLLANYDQAVKELHELRTAVSGGAVSPADGNGP